MKLVAYEILSESGEVMLAYGMPPSNEGDFNLAEVRCGEPFEVPENADIQMLDRFMAMNMKPMEG